MTKIYLVLHLTTFPLDTGSKLNVQKMLYNVLCTFNLPSAFRDLVYQIIWVYSFSLQLYLSKVFSRQSRFLDGGLGVETIISTQRAYYLSSVNNGKTRTMCEIWSNLTIKTPGRRQCRCSSDFFVNFEQISHIVLVFPMLPLNKKVHYKLFIFAYILYTFCFMKK